MSAYMCRRFPCLTEDYFWGTFLEEKYETELYEKKKIDMELDSFPFCLFSFPLSREEIRLVFMFSEPEKMSNKSRFPFLSRFRFRQMFIAISLARKVCCLMKCVEVADDFKVVCVGQYKE